MGLRVYIGYEERERRSFQVAMRTAEKHGFDPQPLREDVLRTSGILTRPTDRRGQMWDLHSNAPQATAFAVARFATPLLAHTGWALFTDCDMVFLRAAKELQSLADPRYAVMVVKHDVGEVGGTKMDGQVQTAYRRKLWSAVMLFNCDHPANKRLNLTSLNAWPGRDLHAFGWLHDDEIGELPMEWNWLVGMQSMPVRPAIAHYTLGTPELLTECPHAAIWEQAAEEFNV